MCPQPPPPEPHTPVALRHLADALLEGVVGIEQPRRHRLVHRPQRVEGLQELRHTRRTLPPAPPALIAAAVGVCRQDYIFNFFREIAIFFRTFFIRVKGLG
jgi:hypothetical protein